MENKVRIIHGDIVKFPSEAIVNAANPSLRGGGGVDGAIHAAAGPELLAECKTLGRCPTGMAKITKGYNLPAKFIIHTVGPIWYGGTEGERELLASCYKNSMEIALERGIKSIAFPLISSGAYGYPKKEAFEVAITTLKAYEASGIEISILLFDPETYKLGLEVYKSLKQ